jgi:hypothetical protein
MAGGNARSAIFLDGTDRTLFSRTLGDACGRTAWRVHAETPEPNLVAGLEWLQNAYTWRFNTRHHV